jgi:hypothetical protein
MATIVRIDCDAIHDRETFHDVFQAALGFPDFYGRNMDAWIDCMTYVDDPDAGMSTVHVAKGAMLTLELLNVGSFRRRCPEEYGLVIECSAFVNFRRIDVNEEPVLVLSFYG